MTFRKPLGEKRTGDYLLRLTPHERKQLDGLVDRSGVETATFLRTIIELMAAGELQVPPSAFDRRL